MKDFDSVGSSTGVLGSAAGLGTSAFILGSSEAVTQNYSDSGFVDMGAETSAGTDSVMDIADGNTPALTTVFGLLSTFAGSSSPGEDIIAIVRTENKKAYSAVEEKAKEIYDQYDQNHIKQVQTGVSLLTESPEVAEAVKDVASSTKNKYELIHQLELLEEQIKGTATEELGPQMTLKK